MARRTVRVTIPKNSPEELSNLMNEVVKYDNSLGANSVLQQDPSIDMKSFAADLATADSNRDASIAMKAQSEDLMQQANNLYGISKTQTIDTPGTLYNRLDVIRRSLLKTNKGSEEVLSNYGFNVVIGQAKSPVRKTQGSKK
jgi:hypothetical protein